MYVVLFNQFDTTDSIRSLDQYLLPFYGCLEEIAAVKAVSDFCRLHGARQLANIRNGGKFASIVPGTTCRKKDSVTSTDFQKQWLSTPSFIGQHLGVHVLF